METRIWRWLDLEMDDPRRNVAIEEAIFRSVGSGTEATNGPRATLRLWRNPPVVVLGCHQWVELEVNLEACRRHGTPVVRRFTGGGAVYHDPGNLNFTLCVPKGSKGLRSGIPDLYDDSTLWLRRMLASLGVEAALVRNRIEVGGKKISGLAASVGRDAALVHGTLLVSTDTGKLREHLEVPAGQLEGAAATEAAARAKRWVRSQPAPVTTIEQVLGSDGGCPPIGEIARLGRGFVESTYGVRLERTADLDAIEARCLAGILERQDRDESLNKGGGAWR